MNGLWSALEFLTTLPLLPKAHTYETRHWRTAAPWYPVVGAAVGGIVWLVGWGSEQIYAGWLPAILAVTAWALVTGGLHLDGLADCCDGLLATVEPRRRLELMRDPRIGAFGAIGLILFLGLKVGAVQEALEGNKGVSIIAAAVLGRTAILWLARQPAARSEGLGASLKEQMDWRAVLLPTLLVASIFLAWGWRGGYALAVAALTTAGVAHVARRRIGGVSGDVFGLTVELVELTVLLILTAPFEG